MLGESGVIDLQCYEVKTGVPITLPTRLPRVLAKCDRCGHEDSYDLTKWIVPGTAEQLLVVNVIMVGIRHHMLTGWSISGADDLCPGCAEYIRQRDVREREDLLCEDERDFVEDIRSGILFPHKHLLDIIDRLAPRPGSDE